MLPWTGPAYPSLVSAGTARVAGRPGASSHPTQLDAFSTVTFQPVTTTRLRAVFDTGYQGTCSGACHAVGVLQWVVAGK